MNSYVDTEELERLQKENRQHHVSSFFILLLIGITSIRSTIDWWIFYSSWETSKRLGRERKDDKEISSVSLSTQWRLSKERDPIRSIFTEGSLFFSLLFDS